MDDDDFDPDAGDAFGDGFAGDPMADPKEVAFNRKDCIIFLIDVRGAMLAKGPNQDMPPLFVAIQSAAQCMADRVITSDSDLIGVILYGTEKSNDEVRGTDHVWTLVELSALRAQTIRALKNRVMEAQTFGDWELKECGGPSADGEVCISEAFAFAQHKMSDGIAKGAHKQVFIFTSDRHEGCPAAQLEQAKIKARDMRDADVHIRLFLQQGAQDHQIIQEPSAFWREVCTQNSYKAAPASSTHTGTTATTAGATDLDIHVCDPSSVQKTVQRTTQRKRTLFQAPLRLPNGHEIALAGYSIVTKKSKPSARNIVSKSNEAVVNSYRLLCETTGDMINQSFGVGHLFPVGDTFAQFEPGEKDKLRDFGPTRLELLGFKSMHRLKPYHNTTKSYFATANDRMLAGSATALRALCQAMVTRHAMAVAIRVTSYKPIYVALLPQEEERADDGSIVWPWGLHIIPLPYNDDIRTPPLSTQGILTEPEELETARALVHSLQGAYELKANPVTAKFYGALEAHALGEPIPDVTDATGPDPNLGGHAAADAVERFKLAVYGEDYVEPTPAAGTKRGASSAAGGAPKAPKVGLPSDIAGWKALASVDNGLDGLTGAQLGQFCAENGLKKSGPKKDQVERICEYLKSLDG